MTLGGFEERRRGVVPRARRQRDQPREDVANRAEVDGVGTGAGHGMFRVERGVAVFLGETRLSPWLGGERGGHEHERVAGVVLHPGHGQDRLDGKGQHDSRSGLRYRLVDSSSLTARSRSWVSTAWANAARMFSPSAVMRAPHSICSGPHSPSLQRRA